MRKATIGAIKVGFAITALVLVIASFYMFSSVAVAHTTTTPITVYANATLPYAIAGSTYNLNFSFVVAGNAQSTGIKTVNITIPASWTGLTIAKITCPSNWVASVVNTYNASCGQTAAVTNLTGMVTVNITGLTAPSSSQITNFSIYTRANTSDASVYELVNFTTLSVSQLLNVTGTVYYYNTSFAGGGQPWVALNGTNVSVWNSSNSVLLGNFTTGTNPLYPAGFFLVTGQLGGLLYNGTNINVTFTTPAPATGPNQNLSFTLKNVNVTSGNGNLNFTVRLTLDNVAGAGENVWGTKPTSNSSMTSYLIAIDNESSMSLNLSSIDFSLPTRIPYAPQGIGVCTRFNSSNLGNPNANSCDSLNYWTVQSGITYNNWPASNITFSVANSSLAGFVNETAFVAAFWPRTAAPGPEPIITSASGVVPRLMKWEQVRSNYSAAFPFVVPDFSTGSYNGMIPYYNSYAMATYLNDFFFNFPSQMEFIAYNLTFNVSFVNTVSSGIIVKIPMPDAQGNPFDCSVNPSTCGYKNQTMLPATWMTVPGPTNLSGASANMQILAKNPSNFSVVINYNNGTASRTIYGGMNPLEEAYFQQGNVYINISGNPDSNSNLTTVSLMLGTQDTTCVDNSMDNNQLNQTKFNEKCFRTDGPPKFESSPIFINNQTIVGFNPFTTDKSQVPQINTSSTTTIIVNLSNPLYNYTANNLFAEFRFPINISFWNGTDYIDAANLSENFTMGWYNQSANWKTVNSTTTPYINVSQACKGGVIDSISGSPTSGRNMTVCFATYSFNLSQPTTRGYNDAEGWFYNDSVVLNLSAVNSFKILSKTSSTPGTAGSSNSYTASVAGQDGLFKLTETELPGLGSANSTSVTVNGQPYYNWTTGSVIIKAPSAGVNVVSVSYTVTPGAASTSTPQQGGTPKTTVTVQRGKTSITIPSIAAGKMAIVNISKTEESGVRQITITVKNSVNSIYIDIAKLPGKPANIVQSVTGNVYHYMEINKTNIKSEDIDKIKIRFAVNKSWMDKNNISADTLALNRFTTKWDKLTTVKVNETSDEMEYEAESPGLSVFAVTGEAKAAAPEIPAPPQPETEEKPLPEKKPLDMTIVYALIAIVVILGIVLVFIAKGKKKVGTGKKK